MRRAWPVILLALALAAPACYRSRNEVVQLESLGYIRFVGNVEGGVATVTRDTVVLVDHAPLTAEPITDFSVRPGMYRVVVEKPGGTVVHREVYVADGQVLEVRVP